jgi:hypothetical protein
VKKLIILSASVVGLGVSALLAGEAFAAAGSGQSADNRNDDFVVICHYDRNQQGPNAGPHTITINVHALDRHLLNHVKKDGFVGDDHERACDEDTTPEPSRTAEATQTVEPTVAPED